MSTYNIKITTEKIKPIKEMFTKEELKYFCIDTNIRTKTTFSYKQPDENSKEEDEINFARNQIFKNQYKIPMKYLQPEENIYLAQKSPLMDKSNNIKNASRIIEPINIGFSDFIKYIPINQNIPLNTTYIINCKIPYESNTRYFFMSNQLKCTEDISKIIGKNKYDFDPYIHIGTLDIGSEYKGRFVVSEVNLNLFDSFSLFNFEVTDNSFSIITYDFMEVDLKHILKECIKRSEKESEKCETEKKEYYEKTKNFINECIKALEK